MRTCRKTLVVVSLVLGWTSAQAGEILTPLMRAARDGNLSLVRALSIGGLGVNLTTLTTSMPLHGTPLKGRTALMFAVRGRHQSVVQLLLERGADPHIGDTMGETAFTYAVANGDLLTVKLLTAKLDESHRKPVLQTMLLGAAKDGHREIVEYVAGLDVDAPTLSSALIIAIYGGHYETTQWLVAHGAPAAGEALAAAVRAPSEHRLQILRLLLDKGVNPNARFTQKGVGVSGMTPLMLAARHDYYSAGPWDVLMLLVERGAELHATDTNGKTALDIAREARRRDSIRFLESPHEFVTGHVVDGANGAPIRDAVISLSFSLQETGKSKPRRVVQQALTDADGAFSVHTWRNPLRREANRSLSLTEPTVLRIYAAGYRRSVVSIPTGFNVSRTKPVHNLRVNVSKLPTAEAARELALWKSEMLVFLNQRDEPRWADEGSHLLLFGRMCEQLPEDLRFATCYSPCSRADFKVQELKFAVEWEAPRKVAVANAGKAGSQLEPLTQWPTRCGIRITSSDQKRVIATFEGPGHAAAWRRLNQARLSYPMLRLDSREMGVEGRPSTGYDRE